MKKKSKSKVNAFFLVTGIIIGIYCISLIIPLLWGLMSSFKGKLEFRTNMFGFPKKWLLSNYTTVVKAFKITVESGKGFRKVGVLEMLFNSIFYAVGCALVQTTVQFVMAYVSARFNYKFGKIIYAIVMFCMIFPIIGTTASGLYVAEMLGFKNSIIGMYVMKSYFLGVYFLVQYAQLKAFPKDYDEAARIDGASNLSIMIRIIFPMSLNLFFTICLLLFIGFWNDYGTPMLYMPEVPTLSYGLYYFVHVAKDNIARNTTMRLAACIMLMFPILVIFLIFHNRLLNNISIGGIKE